MPNRMPVAKHQYRNGRWQCLSLEGSSIFGIGWAFTGLCPGTSLGALGEGRIHAIFTILGMVVGAMIFNRSFDFLRDTVMSWVDFGNVGLSDLTGIPNLIIIPIFVLFVVFLMRFSEKKQAPEANKL